MCFSFLDAQCVLFKCLLGSDVCVSKSLGCAVCVFSFLSAECARFSLLGVSLCVLASWVLNL